MQVDADAMHPELVGGKSALKGSLADVLGDADEEARALPELFASSEIGSAHGLEVGEAVSTGDVVAVQRDDHRRLQLLLDGQRSAAIEREVGVDERGTQAFQVAMQTGSEAGGEIDASPHPVWKAAVFGKQGDTRSVEVNAVRYELQSGKPWVVSAHAVSLRCDEGLGCGKEFVPVDEDAFHCAPSAGVAAERSVRGG